MTRAARSLVLAAVGAAAVVLMIVFGSGGGTTTTTPSSADTASPITVTVESPAQTITTVESPAQANADSAQRASEQQAAGAVANAQTGQSTTAQTTTATTAPTTTTAAPTPSRRGPQRPTIVRRLIPFPQQRKDEMAAYSLRHYGQSSYVLSHPHVIVEHFTVNDSVQATYNTFAPDTPDIELHELPGVCSHFVIAKDGTIVQLVPLALRCRHTVGLNWTAIGIEHVGFSDAEILRNPQQLAASLRLTAWLRCRYGIAVTNVIGHNESLSSPYHRENVARLQTQTHDDWTRADMDVYRAKLREQPPCA